MKQLRDYLVSLVMLFLMLIGLVGIAIHAFRAQGWVWTNLGDTWSFGTDHPVIAVPLALAAVLALRAAHVRQAASGRTGKLPTVIVYALMASGAYFIGAYALGHGI